MSRKPHEPTPEIRQLVQLHTTIGTPQEDVARIVGIDAKTLRKHYRDELDLAHAKANATIGGALFNKAKSGDTAAMIFWMKTRAGWRETNRTELTGADGDELKIHGRSSYSIQATFTGNPISQPNRTLCLPCGAPTLWQDGCQLKRPDQRRADD